MDVEQPVIFEGVEIYFHLCTHKLLRQNLVSALLLYFVVD